MKEASQIKKHGNHFCSRSCSATYNNHLRPKVKPQGNCKTCGIAINKCLRYCKPCLLKWREGRADEIALILEQKQTKFCKKCGKEKNLAYFYKNRNKYSCYCKDCSVRITTERRRIQKQNMLEYKGARCTICGFDKHPAALHLHHRDCSDKEFNFSRKNRMVMTDEIIKELDKCDVVCANCHAIIHAKY